ncbi:unnamed protein product [Effrenium voratum]|uniref:KHDC4/BBP-like KH-domain type I domain-containing protein n=1 Tax=Effrenium voratum TaxID=2562239 RepID=A0AA36IXP7_9DINO|nr:unnamed protein product [Effrenium voratum]
MLAYRFGPASPAPSAPPFAAATASAQSEASEWGLKRLPVSAAILVVAARRCRPARRCPLSARAASATWQELRQTPPTEAKACAGWGCRCGDGPYAYQTSEDFKNHPAVRSLTAWCRSWGLPPIETTALDPEGYRTRGKMPVGPGGSGPVVGLFKRSTWKVVPVAGCAANHPRLVAAVESIEEAVRANGVRAFDHDGAARFALRQQALRFVELTLERRSGLVQLVLVWNGTKQASPQLEGLVERLWAEGRYHSIWVHWREPSPRLLRAIHSKTPEAWEQVRPKEGSGYVVERLDGLDFAFGPASFQQANLQVFERVLQDMKASLRQLLREKHHDKLRLLELCGGVGVIGLSLAHALKEEVSHLSLVSTDQNPNCAKLFCENAKQVEGEISAEFAAMSATEALSALSDADVLILDPPRRGLAAAQQRARLLGGQEEAAAIRNSSVWAVIYMSCGHDSFMADASRLLAGGAFRLLELRCYDMFPYTSHIESLGIFLRQREPADLSKDVQEEPAQQTPAPVQKMQCQFLIGINQDRDFNVRQRLLGDRGHNMKLIASATGAKLRLRGRGSGFKEGPRRVESRDPLMLCISSTDEEKHQEAVRLVRELVEDVYEQYSAFQQSRGQEADCQVQIHEGPRPGSRT